MTAARSASATAILVAALALAAPGIAGAATPGSLDPSFGSGGIASLGSGTQLFGVAAEPDGSVIAVGQTGGGSVLVQCLSPSGSPTGQYVGGAGIAYGVAIQADGRAVVTGSSGGMFVQRFNPGCTPDASFNAGAPEVLPVGAGAIGNAVAIAPDGKIVVAGTVPFGLSTRPVVARLDSSGSLDGSFGSAGRVVLDHGNPYSVATGVAVQPDGRVLVSGSFQSPTFPDTYGWVQRLTAAGATDPSFGSGGVYVYGSDGAGYATLTGVAVLDSGEIVASGSDVVGPNAIFVRLTSAGVPDPSFGSGGVARLPAGTYDTPDPYGAYGVGIAGGGRIVGGGSIYENGAHLAGLWATTPGGAPDTEGAFGSTGTVSQAGGIQGCAIAVAPDGSLLIVGDAVPPTRPNSSYPCTAGSGASGFVARYIGFGPPPPPPQTARAPAVTTGAASGITEASATVSGTVNAEGLPTTYRFDYGTTSAYGSSTTGASAGSGTSPVQVSVPLTGLRPGTTYHYRIEASNSAGDAVGEDTTFITAGRRPSASTGGVLRTTEVSATVTGTVDTGGLPSTVYVEYGTSRSYGQRSPGQSLVGQATAVTVRTVLRGLRPGSTYYYRLVASNAAGSAYGARRELKTAPRLHAGVGRLAGSYKLSTLLLGKAVEISCSASCSVSGRLTVSAAIRRALSLPGRTIGGGHLMLRRKGTGRLVLRLNRQQRRSLSRRGRIPVTVRITVAPIGGGPAVTAFRRLTLLG